MKKERVECMDCSRAICTLWIVCFWHLFEYIKLNPICPATSQITYGVLASFTFISGYFLGAKKVSGLRSFCVFYLKRLISFYPLFLAASTVFLFLGYIENFKQYVFTITGLAGIISTPTLTLWYLCMLMSFYLITPVINIFFGGTKLIIIFFFWIVSILAVIFLGIDNEKVLISPI